MYVAVGQNDYNTIWKVQGNPRIGGLSVSSYITESNSNIYIRSMQSLEQFGFYVTTYDSSDGSETVTQYQLDMEIDPASSTGALLLDADGYDYVEVPANRIATVKTFTDTSYNQRLIQQSSNMYQNRPIYAIVGKSSDLVTYRTSVFEYTSFIQTPAKFEIDETGNAAESRTLDFYQYNVTMQQFHFFTVMPGAIDDDIATTSSIDYTKIKVSIVDLTDEYQDEVMRWSLEGCGDGIWNSTTYSFE